MKAVIVLWKSKSTRIEWDRNRDTWTKYNLPGKGGDSYSSLRRLLQFLIRPYLAPACCLIIGHTWDYCGGGYRCLVCWRRM